jgi:hypothetical protein
MHPYSYRRIRYLKSRTTAPLMVDAIRGYAAAVDATQPAVGMTIGDV